MELKPQQQKVHQAIMSFIKDKDGQVFILKGYAGTGKTTLIAELLRDIKAIGKHPLLMAPTGRAAKVLREKTGHEARTIHSFIYSMGELRSKRYNEEGYLIEQKPSDDKESDNKDIDKIEYFSGLKTISDINLSGGNFLMPEKAVILVDEASLISSRIIEDEVFHFGTGNLLEDLLTFAKPQEGSKLIFIGDPAQLPPIGDKQSNALVEEYFKDKGLMVTSGHLTDVLRQNGGGAILKNAMKIRDLLKESMRNNLTFDYQDGEFEKTTSEDVVKRYLEAQPMPEIGENIIVCFSNALVKEYNEQIRQHYFPGQSEIQEGDVLQIVKNDYTHHYISEKEEFDNRLYNGDFVKVLKVSPTPECKSSFIWKNEGGQRKRMPMQLMFRDIEFLTYDGRQFSIKIIETLLESDKPSLTPEQQMALYILFKMEHQGHEEDADLRNDPYFNALHVKYGYAITAHKSQGGEWKTVFVDYTGRTGLCDDHLRWSYTATTRAAERLFAVNAPHITLFSNFSMSEIRIASKPQKGMIALAPIDIADDVPFMSNFRKWKYASANIHLKEIGCSIEGVEPLQYIDRYHILTPGGKEIIDCYYSDAEIFTRYMVKTQATETTDTILDILKDEASYKYEITYSPSQPSLEALWHKVVSACDELNIPITNIQEFPDRYYVLYSFKTSGKFSTIQFYFTSKGAISRAMPSSDLGKDDILLVSLIEKLSK